LIRILAALVQLFRVSVNASAKSQPDSEIAVAPYARPLGATLIALGMTVLAMGKRVFPFFCQGCRSVTNNMWGASSSSSSLGTVRFFTIQRALPKGLFPAARLSIFLQAVSLATLVGIVFGILVAVH